MSEVVNNQGTSAEIEKPVLVNDVKFPPFPEPTEEEFEDDISDDERIYYKQKFSDLNFVNYMKLHCTACDRHLGSSTRNETRMRVHPMLRTLVCHTCHTFYNSGEFEKGDDGSELYCRWCGQGGQVYCCSDCPHVFCAKCVKRNFGQPKIKEIENADDWKCFKCNPRCLWDLRALCWALLRYCDFKNKIAHKTEDPKLKEAYQKDCAIDHSECCKHKTKRKEKSEPKSAKKDNADLAKKVANTAIARIPATIQVKKFASINIDDASKEKKAQKRPASPIKSKPVLMKNPVAIAQSQNMIQPILMPALKKIRMPVMTSPRMNQDNRKNSYLAQSTYSRIRPRPPVMPIMQAPFNGFPNSNTFHNNSFNPMVINDNINLSLESLTQGLDMSAVAAMSNNRINQDDDVVCTPDFPLEPLCEVTEDNTDDDVQCITPAPAVKSSQPQQNQQNVTNSSAFITRVANNLPDVSSDNIIQMTSDDVSVNTLTGGLKFRVDPQTLSSNKMYRLPDGRIFAINANPNMPGGYSATIVAVTETSGKPVAPKGATYAAKLSAVPSSTPKAKPVASNSNHRSSSSRANILKKPTNVSKTSSSSSKDSDMHVSVEWYRFNLLEAMDSLEYSLARLEKLKKQATTSYLRQRSLDEMRNLHRTLERVLNTSSFRFNEIRDNLNKELKQYVIKKSGHDVSDDDDDVEILPDLNDDPIFIDENSMESTVNETNNENQEVDLTGVGSSDHNDSVENKDDSDMNNAHKEESGLLNEKEVISEEVHNDENDSYSASIDNAQKEIENGADAKDENNGKEIMDNDKPNSPIENNNSGKSRQMQESSETNDDMLKTEVSEIVDKEDLDAVDKEKEDCVEDVKKENVDATDKEKEDSVEDVSMTEQTEDSVKQQSSNDEISNNISSEEKSEKPEKIKPDDECTTENGEKIQEMNESMINNILKEEEKLPEADLSEEMIENLLKDDNVDEIDNILNDKAMDVV
ncbi:hypothetical protein evm_009370 [Chilo suppressalis]|nr:hypothetical protein evm_009370 [Chilo suppressalis]